jgi:branched-chain amino acid transport system permease protein
VQAVVVLVFGSGTQTIRAGNVPEGIPIFGARITVIQIFTILVSSVCCLLVWLLLRQTNIGKKLRAIACDQNLAQICGVNSETVILVAFILGSSLAGSAGILLSLDGDMNPGMGFRLLLMGMLAVIVGGVGSIPGAALGAILLGLIQNFSNWWLSSKWEDMIVFAVLVLFLLLRPQGFLGKPLGKAAA